MVSDFETDQEFITFLKKQTKKIYIYGAGTYGNILGKYLNVYNISWEGYLDGDKEKYKNVMNNKKIFPLSSINKENVLILVSVLPLLNKSENIYNYIIKNGFSDDNIIRFSENMYLVKKMLYRVKKPEKYLKKIVELKDLYKGKRCFILGNGPSIRLDDMRLIKNEIIFGCNTIYQVFEKVSQKLSVLMFVDDIFINNHIKNIKDFNNIMSLCDYGVSFFSSIVYDNYRSLNDSLFFIENVIAKEKTWFETEPLNGLCESGTSLFFLMQLAVYMGIEEIYLLGVDFTFNRELRDGKVIVNNCDNHAQCMEQAKDGVYNVDAIKRAFLCAREFADNNNIKIYNATRGGKLEIFERINFDDWVKENVGCE